MIQEIVGKRIKQLRNKLNISQEELAFRSNVHRTYIASLEVGKRNISIALLERIVNALEISFSEFFEYI
ncbi:MAG: helix-turn-helix transcriptional regulator [Clostridia bacterium]|nr:helix-turn-helix transcriptional regulator [Clostridia bacterium]